jgi:uncharacterized protein (TIGR00369 family)
LCTIPGVRAFDVIVAKLFGAVSPHMQGLGYEVISVQAGTCLARVQYRPELVGDPRSGVLHGGVITSLLDTTGGAAVLSAVGRPTSLATLDLRIDYLRPAAPGRAVTARVECYKKTRHVAFARGVAYDDSEGDPVASMAGTFMLHTRSLRARKTP